MTETEIQTKTYELAYHLSPDLEEQEIKADVKELENTIAKNGGSVVVSREPAKQHLSYSIKHKRQAFFGVMDFNIEPEKIVKINSEMKLNNNIMRYLLIQKPDETKTLTLAPERPIRTKAKDKEVSSTKEEIKPKVSEEKITEELEDVLEKI